ncbi:MAG TPA: hypothetical protein PKA88_39875, partial [Polyangiaceae bacterium]|nr:hypothetical protein [Polyangiaceae bacterium]
MARTTTFSSVLILAAFSAACSSGSDPHEGAGAGAAPSHLPPGVDPDSDDDGDGLKAADDLCLETPT